MLQKYNRVCRDYALYKRCARGGPPTCPYDHKIVLTPEQLAELRKATEDLKATAFQAPTKAPDGPPAPSSSGAPSGSNTGDLGPREPINMCIHLKRFGCLKGDACPFRHDGTQKDLERVTDVRARPRAVGPPAAAIVPRRPEAPADSALSRESRAASSSGPVCTVDAWAPYDAQRGQKEDSRPPVGSASAPTRRWFTRNRRLGAGVDSIGMDV